MPQQSIKAPKEFVNAMKAFQENLFREAGVKVPMSEILRGLAPRLEELMRRKKEVVHKPRTRRRSLRFDFL